MSLTYVLAIDQGTTNTKVLAVNVQGVVVAQASRPVTVTYPQPGWVEANGEQIWQSVRAAMADVLVQMQGAAPVAVGISNQRESVLVWDRKTGKPLGPVVVWQCRRTADVCERLRHQGWAPKLHQSTGLQIDPLFSATKLRWLLDHIPQAATRAAAGDLAAGTMDSWLLWNLTGGASHATDVSNASRTQLLGLADRHWQPELLDVFGVPAQVLPQLQSSCGVFGHTVAASGLPAGVPITALIADSHAALFAQGGHSAHGIKATYGTGSSLLTPTAALTFSRHGLSSTVAWQVAGVPTYALEGNIAISGAVVDWLSRLLFGDDPEAVSRVAALAATVENSGGVYLVPAFVGLGAPHWNTDARGVICGLTRGTGPAQLARAALEAVAYQVKDVLTAMEAEQGEAFGAVWADGGASRNNQLMQFQADLVDRPVVRAQATDLSALGAAYLAGLGCGLWADLQALQAFSLDRERFAPRMPPAQRERLYSGWQLALRRACLSGP